MENLKKCPKCGNIMALSSIIIDSKKKRIIQCMVCRYWQLLKKEDRYFFT